MSGKTALLRLTARLIARRDALRKALTNDLERLPSGTVLSTVGDIGDVAVDSATEELRSQIVELESSELAKIDDALRRIAQGSYGRCEYCGQAISAARLNAVPYTDHCIECQRAFERAGRSRVTDRHMRRFDNMGDSGLAESIGDNAASWPEFGLDFADSSGVTPETYSMARSIAID